MKRFGSYIADDPYFTEPMRDILYTDSQEAFRFFPRKASAAGEVFRNGQGVPASRHHDLLT